MTTTSWNYVVKDGENYRLPTSLVTLKMKNIEVELAEHKAKIVSYRG